MAEERAMLAEAVPSLYHELRSASGDLPDLHIGVVSSSTLGTEPFPIEGCEPRFPHRFLAPAEAGLLGPPYLIDQAPITGACEVLVDQYGRCTTYSCGAGACETSDGTTVALAEDPITGYPRCRNFSGTARGP